MSEQAYFNLGFGHGLFGYLKVPKRCKSAYMAGWNLARAAKKLRRL